MFIIIFNCTFIFFSVTLMRLVFILNKKIFLYINQLKNWFKKSDKFTNSVNVAIFHIEIYQSFNRKLEQNIQFIKQWRTLSNYLKASVTACIKLFYFSNKLFIYLFQEN